MQSDDESDTEEKTDAILDTTLPEWLVLAKEQRELAEAANGAEVMT